MNYVIEMIVLLVGVITLLIGLRKKQKLMLGLGIGVLATFIVLGIPDFIEGFKAGFSEQMYKKLMMDINMSPFWYAVRMGLSFKRDRLT